ncbi:type II toxin-antitoxin system YafO family toxin [Janthinobacterium sp. MDB2-8]|uniref:type II toxin-antitoxin system YafO family toxin n=1 Tax=Janthinobacterium sp. MDB2-8 TaxID=1259338 RepID=UPI003F1F48A6
MGVQITEVLKKTMLAEGLNVDEFLSQFEHWKAGDEYSSKWFGKDGAYARPNVDGKKYMLRHVHLVPIADIAQLAQWNVKFKRKSRKTSDRALVYVSNGKGDYLLIFILEEPDAHEVAEMKTSEHREVMSGFAEVAAEFLDTGKIIA